MEAEALVAAQFMVGCALCVTELTRIAANLWIILVLVMSSASHENENEKQRATGISRSQAVLLSSTCCRLSY